MTHPTTKILRGWYLYRGYEIADMGSHWNIKLKDTDNWTDAAGTLSEAKIMIDRWADQ